MCSEPLKGVVAETRELVRQATTTIKEQQTYIAVLRQALKDVQHQLEITSQQLAWYERGQRD